MAVRAAPAVLILCPSLSSCQCADWYIVTLAVRLLYRPNVQVSQQIYSFSNARATANFLERREGEVRSRPSLPQSEQDSITQQHLVIGPIRAPHLTVGWTYAVVASSARLDLSLGRVNVHVYLTCSKLQPQHRRGMTSLRQQVSVSLGYRRGEGVCLDDPSVHSDVQVAPGSAARPSGERTRPRDG